MIRRIRNKYRVVSKKKGKKGKRKNLGTFSSKAAAKRRLRQIEYFKHLKKRR